MDGRTVAARTIEVLSTLNADIIALQEVIGAGPNDTGHAADIGAALGMGWVMASVRHLRGHQFGNMVLSHYPFASTSIDLSWRRASHAAASAPTSSSTIRRFTSSTSTWARRIANGRKADRLAAIVHDGRVKRRKSCWVISTSGAAAWPRQS